MPSPKMRKGMSELLAIVIGVLITIGVGVALYTVIPRLITANVQSDRIALDVYATTINETAAAITVTIKNLGQINISEIEILDIRIDGKTVSASIVRSDGTVSPVQLGKPISVNLAPGTQISFVIYATDEKGEAIKPGAKVVVVVRAGQIIAHGTAVIMP